ncbi:MAG: glutamine--fructose-6-phosphate transaminase (isomerizing) [Clostridiales bacterium]|nr:glutamine--fructose-6-phosphate transaminase (isomerizing) [Clostridiales bacterium]
MCGIIGYIGKDNSVKHLIEGLRALEYRGYDSAGVAFFDKENALMRVKAEGRLANVEAKLANVPEAAGSHCGIGHTRWATHGAPSDTNSHPHGTAALQIVHNGIIENHVELKAELVALGYTFESDTDTEIAAKLLDYYYKQESNAPDAISRLTGRLRGSYALGILFEVEPNKIYAVRKDSPLIIGIGKGENFIASDITAILRSTRDYYQLEEGELATVTADSIEISCNGKQIVKERKTALWDVEAAERGGYAHFMLKEIHEEPEAMIKTLRPRIKDMLPDFSDEKLDTSALAKVERLHIVACGTAMHAGLIARGLFESLARIPVEVEIASEFRYNDPIIDESDLVIIISQSGETADSLAALRLAKEKGAHTLAIVNVTGSSIAREADSVLYTLAGPEIAVASTKAYTVQTSLLSLLAVECAMLRGRINESAARELVTELYERAPKAVAEMIDRADEVKAIAEEIKTCEDLFFIGRGADYYLSSEGSLKLKEISYIHSEAYAAGELKHGTISLVVPGIPVIALCTVPSLIEKMGSNIREVTARGANAIAVSFKDVPEANKTVIIPTIDPRLAFLPAVTVLQLLAYYTSVARGCDVDKPRNLAKSVTVE